jgi:hypothetical protein
VPSLLGLGQFEDRVRAGQGSRFDESQAGGLRQVRQVSQQGLEEPLIVPGGLGFVIARPLAPQAREQVLYDDQADLGHERYGIAKVGQFTKGQLAPVEIGGVQVGGDGIAHAGLEIGQGLGAGEFIVAVKDVEHVCPAQ